jgi:hypothetical protein
LQGGCPHEQEPFCVPLAHPLEQYFLPRTSTDASLQEHAAELHPALEAFSVLSISSP